MEVQLKEFKITKAHIERWMGEVEAMLIANVIAFVLLSITTIFLLCIRMGWLCIPLLCINVVVVVAIIFVLKDLAYLKAKLADLK